LLLAHPPAILVAAVRVGTYDGRHLALLGRVLQPHMTQLVTSTVEHWLLDCDARSVGATLVQKPLTTTRLLGALYRTLLRDPNADGSIAPELPRLISCRGDCCARGLAQPGARASR